MLHIKDIVHIIFLSTLDTAAMLINAVYIFIILRKTPKSLTSYSALLLNIACVDFLASICSMICTYSLQSVQGRIVLVYLGPCTFVNAHFCHFFLAVHTNLVGQSIVLLLISFAYRLWVLKTANTGQKVRSPRVWNTVQFFIILFIVLNTLTFYFGGSYDVPGFTQDSTFSAIDLTGGIRENILTRLSLFSLIMISVFGFISIIFVRNRLFSSIQRLSKADRVNHQMIYRSLMAQMMLPLAYGPALSLWLLDLFGIVHSSTLQRVILIASSVFALASPLINMYYIPPYRKYLKSLLVSKARVASVHNTRASDLNI